MSVLVAFSVSPASGSADHGVSEAVAEAVRVVRESGLPNQTDAMFTTIEGETLEQVLAVITRATEAVHARSPRVSLVVKADIRDGVSDALHTKVRSVENHLSGHGGG